MDNALLGVPLHFFSFNILAVHHTLDLHEVPDLEFFEADRGCSILQNSFGTQDDFPLERFIWALAACRITHTAKCD